MFIRLSTHSALVNEAKDAGRNLSRALSDLLDRDVEINRLRD
jgi:hypothetical protein